MTSSDQSTSWAKHRVIPLVLPADSEEIWKVWPGVPLDTIAVNYLSLRNNRRLYKAAKENGIRRALQFDGTCISVLVGKNWSLDRTRVRTYARDVVQMGFEAATTHDDYVYWPDPPSYRWSRIHKAIDRARDLVDACPNMEIIGIVKGSNPTELGFMVDKLHEIGIRRVAFPCSELSFERRYDDILWFLRKAKALRLWAWLIGIGSPRLVWRFNADCFSSAEWSYASTLGVEFLHHSVTHSINYPDCSHFLCRSLQQQGLERTTVRARHNALRLVEIDENLRGFR